MAKQAITLVFLDRPTGRSIADVPTQSWTTLPRRGDRVHLPDGTVGDVHFVEWLLEKSRVWGASATVRFHLDLQQVAVDPSLEDAL